MKISQVDSDMSSRCFNEEWKKNKRSMKSNVQFDSVGCLLTFSDGCGLHKEVGGGGGLRKRGTREGGRVGG